MEHPRDHEPPPITSLAKDPVCGMTVDPATAKGGTVEHEGQTYAFCSIKCREKFLADPARYAGAQRSHEPPVPPAPAAVPRASAAAAYTCPMHPEVRSDKPGSCPKCGMALEPVLPVQVAPATQWTCPMHPEIVRDAPGTLPDLRHGARAADGHRASDGEDPELRDMTRRFWSRRCSRSRCS